MGTFTTIRGKQIYTEVFGPTDAPAVLYLHGGPGASCYDFVYFQKAHLEQDLRVIAIDQRGVLRSEPIGEDEPFGLRDLVEDCEALRESLGIERWAVLGHSFGGQLAVDYCLSCPDAVSALLLESPGLDWDSTLRSHLMAMATEFLAEGNAEMARQCWGIAAQPMDTSDKMHKFLELQGALGARWERTHIHGPNKDVFQTIFQSSGLTEEHFRRIWTHAMKLLDEGLLYESTLPKLGHIRVPSLLLLGKYDRVTTPEQVRAFVENVPGAKVAVFEQSGHFPRIDEPAKYAEQVIQFVREHCD